MKRTLLLTLPALLLAGCAAASEPTQTDALAIESRYPLDYAQQFTVDECAGGYSLITIDGSRYLVVPEGAAVPAELDDDIVVLQQPIENIYLVSSSAMDPIISIGGLGAVALSGTQAENWYLDAARTAMEQGQIVYAGKYSAPDYETILAADCGLAIENTMIYHTPEVKEQLEKFGVPVLVERSSYESGPLARMEWVKLYGILLGKTNEAERVFADAEQRIAPLGGRSPHRQDRRVFLHHLQQPCHCAQRRRLRCRNDQDGGRQLRLCRFDRQRQQPGDREYFAGRFLRRGQGCRRADL